LDTFRGKTFDDGPLRSKGIHKMPMIPRGGYHPLSLSTVFI